MTEWLKKVSKSDIRNILSITIVLGCFVIVYLLIVKEIPEKNKDVVNIAVGFILGGALAGVIGYYFGASKAPADAVKKEEE